MLLFIAFINLVNCFYVKNNSWGNSWLLKFLAPDFRVVPSLFFTAVFKLLNCKFDNLIFNFIVFNHFIYSLQDFYGTYTKF